MRLFRVWIGPVVFPVSTFLKILKNTHTDNLKQSFRGLGPNGILVFH